MRIDNFSAYDIYKLFPDLDNDRYYNYKPKKKNKLVKGAKYSLKGMSCDGFDMPDRVYEVVAIVNEVHDVPLNSVVMRQLEGLVDDVKYTLNKSECQTLHIKYEPGLQLFPIEMQWKKYQKTIPTGKTTFEQNDMSTYPVSRIDGNIRYIILRLDDYFIEDNIKVVSKINGKSYPIDVFLRSLTISSKGYISSGREDPSSARNIFYMKTEKIPFRILNTGYTNNDNYLYVELFTKKPSKNIYTQDGISGINPVSLMNKKIDDIFEVILDEFKLSKKNSIAEKIDMTNISPKSSFGVLSKLDSLYKIPAKSRVGDMYFISDEKKILYNAGSKILTFNLKT